MTTTKKSRNPKSGANEKTSLKSPRKWSKKVNETSNAMDLEKGIFKSSDPKKIASSVKRSAERSKRKKAGPFQSAMSMLNFYENRGGKNLNKTQKSRLNKAKNELRKLFKKKQA